ncbi:MAG TPA: tetratricopeptide repeat protein [Oscillatoriaceae cyanobacterium M33_DOE_052]|nr:tetratricopeptide repeat protein [Oscillatoriaceae cyanobacterium M33_DOE_052]
MMKSFSRIYVLRLLAVLCLPCLELLSLTTSLSMAAMPVQSSNETRKAAADRLLQQREQQLDRSQFSAALQSFQTALKIYQEIGSRADEAMALTNIGAVYSSLRQYPQALNYHQQALTEILQHSQ